MPSDFDDVSDYDNDGLINAEEIDWESSLIKNKSLRTYDNLPTIDDCISHFSDKGELSYVQNGLTRLQALPGNVYSELMTIRILPINSDPLSVDGDRDIIQTIYVQKYDKVVSNWNNMTSYVDDIHLFCHGGVCQLYFFGEDVDLTDISELNTYNITGKLYLYSCHGGTYSNEYDNTMAWELSKRINGKKVIAVNGDSVDCFRMWLPFSKKPVLHDGIGYWAEYYWIYCNDKYIRYSNPLGREWRT